MSGLSPVELTQTVKKGGCAAKLPAGTLKEILASLPIKRSEGLVLGSETLDDACLWDLQNGQYLVQTLDFFTPIVDNPKDFGAIAAANALSDIYAMGGRPALALSILAFPTLTLDNNCLKDLMEGALEVIHESGACLAGGHTIDDETLKLGFSVTGFVDKSRTWTNQGAQPGDHLILTKPLGTGTIATAIKNREARPEWIEAAIASMKTLNKVPPLVPSFTIHGATDITGFGLVGHTLQMARASGVSVVLNPSRFPVLPGARELLEEENLNRAHKTNFDYVCSSTDFVHVTSADKWLSVDPQTSGGLLLAVPPSESQALCETLRPHFPHTTVIGMVRPERPVRGAERIALESSFQPYS